MFVIIKHNLGGIAQRDKPQEADKSMKEKQKQTCTARDVNSQASNQSIYRIGRRSHGWQETPLRDTIC